VEQDRVGNRDEVQPGDEGPRVCGHDEPGQAVGEAHRHHQRADAVLGSPQPREEPGPDEGRADDRPEDRDQVAVMPPTLRMATTSRMAHTMAPATAIAASARLRLDDGEARDGPR
jgi:hypothetical protein